MKYFVLIFFCSYIISLAQFKISGKVTDEKNIPLPGVNILIKGTHTGTASDADGNYTIENISPGKYNIVFSFLGFKSKSASVEIINSNMELNIILKEEAVESAEIVVAAGKYKQRISELPVSAEIMPVEEMMKRNLTNLEDAMRYIPGLNMTQDQLSIRGSSGYSRGAGTRVLLAIDGIPFSTGDTGEIIWYIVPVTELQRIEVIKGAASSLYGSSAIGGVVNLITKEISDEPSFYIKTNFGFYDKPSYSEWDWSGEHRKFNGFTFSHSNRINNFGFTAALTRLEDEGYKQSGFYHRYIGYFKGRYQFTPVTSLSLIFNSVNQRNGNFIYWKDSHNALVPPDADQGQRIATNRYMSGLIFNSVLSNDLQLNIKTSYYRTDWKDQTESANFSKTDLFRGEVQATYSADEDVIIVSGVEGSFTEVNSNIFNKPDGKSAGVYSQADIHFSPELLFSAGIRYDYTQLYNLNSFSAFSPKLGINYNVDDKIILRSSFGSGFRAPSVAEAFTSTTASGITIKPNPELQPETNYTFEAGINYQPMNELTFDAAIFHNEFYDFIEPGIDPKDGRVIFDNLTRARIQGFELNTNLVPCNNLNFYFSYTYLWARDIQKKKFLKYRPRHLALAGVEYSFAGAEFGADFRFWSKVEEIDFELIDLGLVPDGELRTDVAVLDLRAGYNFINSGLPLRVFLNLKNAFNYNYVELIGNLAPIRNISLSAELIF